ncbi:unnamed protein product [Didymodactylos carnosus]|uniref:VWFA domain-containing protein n=1 Tax=Didymodactylos carnosus TaxID=1234261 RepID=A0A8S2TMQ7_9BILA|nr:unnamed protein product [Didymodactylos carnosus]CAF4296037.1 unnamed protein product [Didymodactylos carnosus]
MANLTERLNIGPHRVHISIIKYSTTVEDSYIFSKTGTNQLKGAIVNVIKNLKYTGGSTATGDAISRARQICDRECREKTEAIPRAVVLFTDGNSNTGKPVGQESALLREQTKATVFAVGIGSGINELELQLIATKPYETYVLRLSNYLQLTQVINEVTIIACKVPAFIEAEIKGLRNGMGGFMETAVNVTAGDVKVYTSLTEPNPTSDNSRQAIAEGKRQQQDGKSTVDIYIEYIPPGSTKFYTSFKGLNNQNKYTFKSKITDLNGGVIG